MTDEILKTMIINRYNYELVNLSYEELVDRFKYELYYYKNEKYVNLINKMDELLESEDWLNDAFYTRINDYKYTGNFNMLSKPLNVMDIKEGVADEVNTTNNDSNEKERRENIMKVFNDLYKNYLELTNMLVDRLSYLFSNII